MKLEAPLSDAASNLKAKSLLQKLGPLIYHIQKRKSQQNLSRTRPALRTDSSIQKPFLHGVPLIPGMFG